MEESYLLYYIFTLNIYITGFYFQKTDFLKSYFADSQKQFLRAAFCTKIMP